MHQSGEASIDSKEKGLAALTVNPFLSARSKQSGAAVLNYSKITQFFSSPDDNKITITNPWRPKYSARNE